MFALVLAAFALVNAFGAALFVVDKRAAIANRRRVPERTLLLTALLGAAPAMLLLRGRIRHKTYKQPFGRLLWGAAFFNALMLAGLAVVWLA